MTNETLTSLRDNISKAILAGLAPAFQTAEKLLQEIESLRSRSLEETAIYQELRNENERVRADIKERLAHIRKAEEDLAEEKATFERERAAYSELAHERKEELSRLTASVKRLSQEKSDLEAEVKQIEPLKLVKQRLEDEVNATEKKLRVLSENTAKIESDHEHKLQEIEKARIAAQKALAAAETATGAELKKTENLRRNLDEREKAIAEKENGLVIIEKRWKELYESRDASFRL